MSLSGTIAKNTAYSFFATIMELLIGFATGIVLARSLGAEQFGVYSYLMWLVSVAAVFTNLGLGETSKRYIAESVGRQTTHESMGLVRFTLVIRFIAALIICLIILVTTGYWAKQSGEEGNQMLIVLVAIAAFPHIIQYTVTAILRGFQNFKYVTYVMLATYPLRLVLIIIIMNMGYGVMEIMILHIAALSLGMIVGFFLLNKLMPLKKLLSPSQLSSETRKRAIRYSLILTGTIILSYLVNEEAEIFLIGLFCSAEEIGFYTLAFRLGRIVGIIPSAFALVLLPAIAEQFGRGDMERIKSMYLKAFRLVMVLALPVAFGSIAIAEALIVLLYGEEFMPAVLIFQIISLPFAILSLTRTSDAVIRGINLPGVILITLIGLSILKIGLGVWLISEYKILGAAITHSITLVLGLPIYTIFISKNIGGSWPKADTIKICLASVVMGAAVYFTQSRLDTVPSLIVGVPLGVIIYLSAIFSLKVIDREDIAMFRRAQDQLPLFLKKYYVILLDWMEKIVVKTNLPTRR
jgi:O-antigen/teichoic acid export membrane protein